MTFQVVDVRSNEVIFEHEDWFVCDKFWDDLWEEDSTKAIYSTIEDSSKDNLVSQDNKRRNDTMRASKLAKLIVDDIKKNGDRDVLITVSYENKLTGAIDVEVRDNGNSIEIRGTQ